jgi:hypothetical protein
VVTSSLRESIVTVECGHGNGSMMVMGWGGAMRIGEGTRGVEQEAARRRGSENSSGAEAQEARAVNAKCER